MSDIGRVQGFNAGRGGAMGKVEQEIADMKQLVLIKV